MGSPNVCTRKQSITAVQTNLTYAYNESTQVHKEHMWMHTDRDKHTQISYYNDLVKNKNNKNNFNPEINIEMCVLLSNISYSSSVNNGYIDSHWSKRTYRVHDFFYFTKNTTNMPTYHTKTITAADILFITRFYWQHYYIYSGSNYSKIIYQS